MNLAKVSTKIRVEMGLLMVAALVGGGPVAAETFCVEVASDLGPILADAASNGEDDVIQVVQGSYATAGSPFTYFTLEDFSLQLLGGFTTGCASRVIDPTNTIFDGQNANQVVELMPGNNTGGNLVFQGFTVRNGNGASFHPGGLSIGGSAGHWGDVIVQFNIIGLNHSATGAGGLFGGSDLGVTRIENNLIVNNTSDGSWGAGQITSNGAEFFITNNTVAGNTAPTVGGLRLSGAVPCEIANNILWGNGALDLDLGALTPKLLHNDIGVLNGIPGAGSVNNVSVDPVFVGGGDYRLLTQSPVINVGTNFPAGGLPVQDLEGKPRIQGTVVDMGAYESPVLFADGFEEGDTSAWSATVPDP